MHKTLAEYELILREGGCRTSLMRRALLGVFMHEHKPLSVAELLELLARKGFTPNKTSVYRELTLLQEADIVTTVHLQHGTVYYELADLDHHHHAVCTSCTSVIDIYIPESIHKALHEMEASMKKDHGFVVQNHMVDLRGLCKDCRVTA